jgi:MFS family permease
VIAHVRAAMASVPVAVGRYRVLLRHRDARLLLSSALASEIGDWFNIVALIALSYRFGEGALGVGVMLALRMAPRLLFQAPAGTLVDRHRESTGVLIASQVAAAAVAAAFTLLSVLPELWLLYLLVFLLESVGTVAWPAFRVQVARHVAPEARGGVNALLSICATLAQLVGPAIGSAVLVATDPNVVFIVNALTFLGNAAAATRLSGETTFASDAPDQADSSVPSGGRRGYAWLLRRPAVAAYGAIELSAMLLIYGTIPLFVTRSEDLGLGDLGTGIFYSAVAVGSVMGSAAAGIGRHEDPSALRLVAGAMGLLGVTCILFGAAAVPALAVAALVLAGAGTGAGEVVGLTHFQHRLPDAIYGRFLSVYVVVLSVGGIVGALVGPLLAQEVGVVGALTIIAVPIFVFAALLPGTGKVPRGDTKAQARL